LFLNKHNTQTIQGESRIVDKLLFATWSRETNWTQHTPTKHITAIVLH